MRRQIPLMLCCFLGGLLCDRLTWQPHRLNGTTKSAALDVMPTTFGGVARMSPTASSGGGRADEPTDPIPASAGAGAALAPTGNPLSMSRVSLTAHADLSEVTFSYHLTPIGRSANVGLQIFAHRDDLNHENRYEQIAPKDAAGADLILNLYEGMDNTGTFKVTLPKGVYGACRLLLFNSPDGKSLDYNSLLYDSNRDPAAHLDLRLTVGSAAKRIVEPQLEVSPDADVAANDDGTFRVTFHADVKIPEGYRAEQNGFWVMAKGDAGFAQEWVGTDRAQPAGNGADTYRAIPISLVLKSVKTGLWNSQFGLFKYSWGDPLAWISAGVDFEAGGDRWEQKAANLPPRLRVRNRRFETLDGRPFDFYPSDPAGMRAVSFVRGGNYGNALDWTLFPEYNRPGYFTLLKEIGCRFMRTLFDPDRYIRQAVYRDAVDQVVQNIWAGGLYPVLAPQGLAKGSTPEAQARGSVKVVQFMAARYKGEPIWLEVCNEPHEFGSWEQWKPVAVELTQAIRRIDPEAFVIVPLEGWSKDGRSAAKDPIRETAVDLYDGHAYVPPADVATDFAPAVRAGLPLMIGEYGGSATYLDQMDSALQHLSGLMAAGPWAFTKAGQDRLPLVADGSTAQLRFTLAGERVAADYALWAQGKKK
jgi:hypothetical protein